MAEGGESLFVDGLTSDGQLSCHKTPIVASVNLKSFPWWLCLINMVLMKNSNRVLDC